MPKVKFDYTLIRFRKRLDSPEQSGFAIHRCFDNTILASPVNFIPALLFAKVVLHCELNPLAGERMNVSSPIEVLNRLPSGNCHQLLNLVPINIH